MTPRGGPSDPGGVGSGVGGGDRLLRHPKGRGDDPDATSGLLIYATVRPIPAGVRIDGGALGWAG